MTKSHFQSCFFVIMLCPRTQFCKTKLCYIHKTRPQGWVMRQGDTWWRHKCALCKYIKKCDIHTDTRTDRQSLLEDSSRIKNCIPILQKFQTRKFLKSQKIDNLIDDPKKIWNIVFHVKMVPKTHYNKISKNRPIFSDSVF